MPFSQPIVTIIKNRKSIRNYQQKDLSEEDTRYIQQISEQLPVGPSKNQSQFSLMVPRNQDDFSRLPGTYGMIRGATSYLAGAAEDNPHALLDFGYQMEWLILKAWDRGISSCWLGGTFQRSRVLRYTNFPKEFIIPAVTPLGYAKEQEGLMDSVIHTIMGSNQRKPWQELFFVDRWDNPINDSEDEVLALALEMVRLGPSAVNRQPWRLILNRSWVHFYIQTKGITSFMNKGIFPPVDLGVACCHFELTMRECQRDGRWLESQQGKDLERSGLRYFISWKSSD